MAKAAAEMFEVRQARAEGASAEEARERARKAGELAFATATQDVAATRAEQEAYEARQEEKRLAAAARAAELDAQANAAAAAAEVH